MLLSVLGIIGGAYALERIIQGPSQAPPERSVTVTRSTLIAQPAPGVSYQGARYGAQPAVHAPTHRGGAFAGDPLGRCIYGAVQLTRGQWEAMLDSPISDLQALFAMPDWAVKRAAASRGVGEVTKDDIRASMKQMPGWFQKAYAARHFGGDVDKAIAAMGAAAGITVPNNT